MCMHKYAIPRRIVIFCLLFFLTVLNGSASSAFAARNVSFLGIFNQQLPTQQIQGLSGPLVDALNDYRSAQSGNWNLAATWQRYDGSNWVAAASAPTTSAGVITIRSPHTVTISTDGLTYDQVIIEAGGQVTVNSGLSHILNNGSVPGTDLIIRGTFLNQGSWSTSGATWSVENGGTYIHSTAAAASTIISDGTLVAGSTFVYRGSSTLAPNTSVSNKTYSNLSFESSSGTYTTNLPNDGSSPLTVTGTFRVGPNVNWSKGSFTGTLSFNGDILVEGTLSSNTAIIVGSGKVMTLSGTGSAAMSAGSTLTINGTLKSGASNISGAGNFTLGASGTLEIGSPDGITISPTALGNIRNTGTRTFNAAASYVYNGSSAQVTGNALPSTVGNLKIDNAAGVTLSAPTSVNGTLDLSSGKLTSTSTNMLSAGGLANSITGGSSASYVNGPLRRTFGTSPADPLVYPVGKSSFNPFELVNAALSTGTATVEAEVFDNNSNGTAGTGLSSISSSRYWGASIISGAPNFLSSRVRLTDSSINANSLIGKSATVNGSYNSIGGTVNGSSILSNAFATFSFFVIGSPAITQYSLNVNKSGPGSVTSTPAGINCGVDCAEAYNAGTQVTLTASPDAGGTFTGWSGGGCSGTSTCQVTMNAAATVTASFASLATPTISVSDVSAPEGQSGTKNFDFSVTLSSPAPVGGVNFDITTAGTGSATAGVDYVTKSSLNQTIPAGGTGPYTFSVVVNGDTETEPNETFGVNLSINSGATAGDLQAIGTIQNDDVPLRISSNPVVRTAGDGSNSAIANVSDSFYAVNTLNLSVDGRASSARNGVTVSNISVSEAGVVTADVSAALGASDAAFTLTATNPGSQSAVSTLQVIVLSQCPDGTWAQQSKKTPSDEAASDGFGVGVAISGNTAIVGANGNDGFTGAAYIFTRTSGVWTQQQKLIASDGAGGSQFGVSVALSGDTALIGAFNNGGKGAAYVFTRSGTVWAEQQKLTAADGVAGDLFGWRVGISADTAIVSAYGRDEAATDSGAAYVFTRNGASWTQQQKLTASDAAATDRFGFSVAISGDTAVLGAIYDSDLGNQSGSAYVFTRSGTAWSQQQKLTAPDGGPNDEFGYSTAISGDTLIVGAWGDDYGTPTIFNTGSAHVFTRTGTTWSHQQKLTASDAGDQDFFGFSVAISGNTVMVGSARDDLTTGDEGSAYLFNRTAGVWTQKQKLTASDGANLDRFGTSVAVSSDTALAGANLDDDKGLDSGSAYWFNLSCPPSAPEIAVAQSTNINSGDTYDFGDQPLNEPGALKQFKITNNGGSALTITAPYTKSGPHLIDFQDTGALNATLQAGESTSFYISFYPSALGIRTAKIEIQNGDSDENPFVINLKGNGVASQPDQFTLSITKSGNGSGVVTSSPAGIDCGATCGNTFAQNAIVTLTAAANTGSKFIGWTGGCTGASNSCQVTVDAAKTVNAQFSLITISGKVRLRNTLDRTEPLPDVPVSGVSLNAPGPPAVSGSSGADGNYSLSGFGSGSYTVTPSKADQTFQAANGVFIDDASTVARYVVGLEPGFTAHQIAAADVSGVSGVSSFDATLIARWVVGLPDTVNRSGKWAFSPTNVNHGVVTNNIVQNYDALLYGDVNGDYQAPQVNMMMAVDESSAVRVSLNSAYARSGSTFIVPLKLENLNGASVMSYQFDIQYDPAVLIPDTVAADVAGTVSQGMNVVYNVPSPGLLKVAVYDVFGVIGDGVYANLRFAAAGPAGSATELAVKGFRLNDGKMMTTITDGNVFVGSSSGVSINGRLVTAAGNGLRGTQVLITGSNGGSYAATSSSLGYFEFSGLAAGDTYTLTVQSRRYRFSAVNVSASQAVTSVEMTALE
jgi:hypothetical protein